MGAHGRTITLGSMSDGICSVATPTFKLKLTGTAEPNAGAVAAALAKALNTRMTKENYPALVDANGALPDCSTTTFGPDAATCAPEKVTCVCTSTTITTVNILISPPCTNPPCTV